MGLAARVEVIANLGDMCLELLHQWITKLKTRPQRVHPRTFLGSSSSLTPACRSFLPRWRLRRTVPAGPRFWFVASSLGDLE